MTVVWASTALSQPRQTAHTQQTAVPPEAPPSVELPIQRARLDNGLRVVLSPDSSVPTVAIAVYYDVGSRVEEPGRTGFAHLFEHLMFEGTRSLRKGEFDRLLALYGADSNATTSEDRTNYFEMLPANALELGLFLEADRMRALDITAEAFENQRITVTEERRQTYENQPYALSFLRRDELLYEGYFPYAHSTIGDARDLEMSGVSPAEQLRRVVDFHSRYYAPDNAVLAIAGDFDPDAAMAMVRRQFGPITARRGASWVAPTFEPHLGERRESIVDPHAQTPGLHLAWRIPPYRSEDHYALELLTSVLGGGESSRLYRALVHDQELLAEVDVSTGDRRGPDVFAIWSVCAQGHTADEARRAIDTVMASVLSRGVTARELEKAKNNVRAGFVFGLERPLDRALYLGSMELYTGDARNVNTELARYEAVTTADLQRVARLYLRDDNRVVLEVVPGATESHTPTNGR